ncbi:MAG: dihydrolipoyl dehydrogenase [Candidatus Omnitrophota bacterium]
MLNKYDYVVIGSGPAGHSSAVRASELGLKTAVVEKDENMFGGVCLNEGCIPAKSLFRSAEIYQIVKKNAESCGFTHGSAMVDLPLFVKKSRDASNQLRKGLEFVFKTRDIDLIQGTARFCDNKNIVINSADGNKTRIQAERFLIATGSRPKALAELPFDGKRVITSRDAMSLKNVPRKMLVVGAGAIGVEFASFFSTIGAEVTVVEIEPYVLLSEDRELSRWFEAFLKKKGIKVLTSSRVKDVAIDEYDTILVSIGRAPSTFDLGLEDIGVNTDKNGFIRVDGKMRSSVKNIFAAGDVLNTPMLAHSAFAEGERAAETAAGKKSKPVDYDSLPNAVYTELQLSSVGITEEKAKERKLDVVVGKSFFKACGKAVINSQTEGFVKVIADKKTLKIIGAHILGYAAAEMIHEFVVAKRKGLTVGDIADTVHAHPTFSEAAAGACRAARRG